MPRPKKKPEVIRIKTFKEALLDIAKDVDVHTMTDAFVEILAMDINGAKNPAEALGLLIQTLTYELWRTRDG